MAGWLELRGSYTGPAEVWSNGSKLFDVTVALKGYVNVVHIRTIGWETDMDNTVSWDGILLGGMAKADQLRHLGQRLELHLPSGKVGNVHLVNTEDSLSGSRWPPFPITYRGVEISDESEILPDPSGET